MDEDALAPEDEVLRDDLLAEVGSLLTRLPEEQRVSASLHGAKFDDLAQKPGFSDFVKDMGVETDAAVVLAGVVKWFVRLIVLVVAFDRLGLPAVSVVLQRLLLWIPNLIVAMVVLALAVLAAHALADLVRGATKEAGLGSPDLLATVAEDRGLGLRRGDRARSGGYRHRTGQPPGGGGTADPGRGAGTGILVGWARDGGGDREGLVRLALGGDL